MDENYAGVPLSPGDIHPIGFEMHNRQAGITPTDQPASLYPNPNMSGVDDPPLPPPPPPIGFEAHESETPPTNDPGGGEVNKGFQEDSNGKPETRPAPEPPRETVTVPVSDEEKEDFKDDIVLLENTSPQNGGHETMDASLFMNDGVRRIDFVMVYKKSNSSDEESERETRRGIFHSNLENEGLELEISEREYEQSEKLFFVKVHATWDVLTKYAEIMNMKMPLAENDLGEKFETCWSKCPTPFDYDESILPEINDYFTAPFSRAREKQFIIESKDTFFSPAQRSLLTHQILERAVFEDLGDPAKNKFGIKKMLGNGCYDAAFPLHEGDYKSEHSLLSRGADNQRHLLYETWARPGAWFKFQPLDHIRLYFGEKIAIYFTWLGHYTGLLIPAGLVGLAIFIYGCARIYFNKTSNDICDENGVGNLTMCPLCDGRCDYWKLHQSCVYSRVTYLFDNEATVAFAAFMALWSTFFYEMWKRRGAEIEYDWDVADFEEEETIRPEFEASVRRRKVNPINKKDEPYLDFASRVWRAFSSLSVVLFMLCVVVAAVFGVIVYRLTVSALLYAVNQDTVRERASIITSITASVINLIIIVILGKVYQFIAQGLTNFETHRTLTEWEDSFTLKMFLFQFVNHYASLFYIAFVKGKTVGRPGDYNRDLGKRQEECDPAGCLIELCIQLAIIMVGKQIFNNSKEIILPVVMNWFKSRKVKEIEKKEEKVARWEKDYSMSAMPNLGLFDEYLEMVIQYGFVTIFVAAFPLAPLFALLNNIIEIRLDAYKFITQWRRPLAMRAQDIGIWFGILRGIARVAIMSNAVIIAFTSEFVPKLVYMYAINDEANLDGYVKFSLSVFNVTDFEEESIPDNTEFPNVTKCRYRDHRTSTPPYKYNIDHWHILAARLAFVIVFVLAVQLSIWLVSYLVPDVPRSVKMQMLREKYLAREAVLEADHLRPGASNVRNGDKAGVRHRQADAV